MDLTIYLQHIQNHLIRTHAEVMTWFETDDALKQYRPKDGGWTVLEILEHIALTSHYLLILIDKGAGKALRNVQGLDLNVVTQDQTFKLDHLDAIGIHQSFTWIRPEHMEPRGIDSESAIKGRLIDQLRRCLDQLYNLRKGEGLLYLTTMTVDDLGKLNVYEYIYFLSKHAERHVQQMAKNYTEFEDQTLKALPPSTL